MYVVVDTETTGLHVGPVKAHPIEIAAICLDDFDTSFCERIRPSIPIDPKASAIHGMTNESLDLCRNEMDVMRDFVTFLDRVSKPVLESGGSLKLIAHNTSFDLITIYGALARCGLSLPNHTWVCTMRMSRSRYSVRGNGEHTLKRCCERAGIPYENAHEALADAKMCGLLFKSFKESSPIMKAFAAGAAGAAGALVPLVEVESSRRSDFFTRAH